MSQRTRWKSFSDIKSMDDSQSCEGGEKQKCSIKSRVSFDVESPASPPKTKTSLLETTRRNSKLSGGELLLDLVRKGDVFMVEKILGKHCEYVDYVDRDGSEKNIMHLAVENVDFPMVQFFVSMGIKCDCVDALGKQPLHLLADLSEFKPGNALMARTLVQNGGSVKSKDEKGNTPLHYAVMRGNRDLVASLISMGSKSNEKNNVDMSSLDCLETYQKHDLCYNYISLLLKGD